MALSSIGNGVVGGLMLVPIAMSMVGCSGLDDGTRERVQSSVFAPTPSSGPVKTDALCSVQCDNGTILSCNSATCSANDAGQYITCNGVVHGCPCSAEVVCETGGVLSCTGTSGPAGTCSAIVPYSDKICDAVECNGVLQLCPELPGDELCF